MTKTLIKRYILVGGTSYVIEIASLYTLNHIIGFNPVSSVAISFWIGLLTAFILQKFITFRSYDKKLRVLAPQLVRYAILVTFNYAVTILAVKVFSRHISVIIIRTIVILLLTVFNFMMYRLIFKSRTANL